MATASPDMATSPVGELEDGELSGGWEDDDADSSNEEEDEEEEEEIIDYRTEGLTPVVMKFGGDNQFGKDHKKNSKRRKGKGALSRQRKKSRLEKMQKSSNEPTTEVNELEDPLPFGIMKRPERIVKAGEKQQKPGSKRVEVDIGPEEGEVVEEDNRGLLSQLVEEEVGLWTTDVGDEQITRSKIDSDEDGKKKTRAPISAERKLKKKVAFRRKRAEKEKELGIRRPRMPTNTFKPKIPLCKFYIKGRCTLGANCTFSHDVVPVTKSDPCKFFMVNRCLKGDDCPFSHSLDSFPCKFWHTRGHCLDGSKCRFSHGPLTEDQRQNLTKRIEHDAKEQPNVPDIVTDFNKPDDSDCEYMPTASSSRPETLATSSQLLNQDAPNYASTSMASHSFQTNREVPSQAQTSEINREEIVLTETIKEETPVENAVLMAARKAASAAAAAAGTADKLLGFSSRPSLLKTRTFGRPAGRGGEASSAMDLLQATTTTQPRCVETPSTSAALKEAASVELLYS